MSRSACNDQTGYENMTGETPDISEYLNFDFYSWAKFYDKIQANGESYCQWLGINKNRGQGMVYYILQSNGQLLSHLSVHPLTNDEWLDPQEKKWRDEFVIYSCYGCMDTWMDGHTGIRHYT
jgi:hypothetical protein